MLQFNLILLSILAYLAGSVPTAVWIGRLFYNVDVRKAGSGNAGATNTIRVLGWKAGVPVLLFDVFKAWFAVKLPLFIPVALEGDALTSFQLLLGALAVAGHIFPVFAGFKGGKGVASITGIVIALFPETFLVVLGVFAIVFLFTGYVSLASLTSSLAFPVIAWLVFGIEHHVLLGFAILVAVLIPLLHVKNIRRLLKGTESKILFTGKRKPKT